MIAPETNFIKSGFSLGDAAVDGRGEEALALLTMEDGDRTTNRAFKDGSRVGPGSTLEMMRSISRPIMAKPTVGPSTMNSNRLPSFEPIQVEHRPRLV